jgi:hypothetical protein
MEITPPFPFIVSWWTSPLNIFGIFVPAIDETQTVENDHPLKKIPSGYLT